MGTLQERNRAVVEQLCSSFNDRDEEALTACYADPIVVHASGGESRTMDHAEHWDEVQAMFGIFPDLSARIDATAAEGDHVFVRGSYTGTHSGDGGAWEPTGRTATWAWWCDYRLEDGRIVEAWNCYDDLTRLVQLGLWAPPGRTEDE